MSRDNDKRPRAAARPRAVPRHGNAGSAKSETGAHTYIFVGHGTPMIVGFFFLLLLGFIR